MLHAGGLLRQVDRGHGDGRGGREEGEEVGKELGQELFGDEGGRKVGESKAGFSTVHH